MIKRRLIMTDDYLECGLVRVHCARGNSLEDKLKFIRSTLCVYYVKQLLNNAMQTEWINQFLYFAPLRMFEL